MKIDLLLSPSEFAEAHITVLELRQSLKSILVLAGVQSPFCYSNSIRSFIGETASDFFFG